MTYTPKPIAPPWKGVVDDVPSILAPSSSFASCSGFWIEKQRLRSALARTAAPAQPLGPVIGQKTFLDALGNLHTVVFTPTEAYYYVNGVYTAIISTSASLTPVKTEVYQNVLIATNGSGSPVAIDGSASPYNITLPNNGTCFFLGKLAGRMLYLNLIEPAPGGVGSSNYPRRFRWSQVNNGNNFTDFTAGVADISEIEDNITGYAAQGSLGYIYRSRGITVITPTGGISPTFYVENYSAGNGLGNFFPYSLAQYGNLTVFAAEADINAFNPMLGPPQPIGGSAVRSIYTDLNSATGYAIGQLLGTMGSTQQGLQYWLAAPQAGNTSALWLYQFDSQTWARETVPFNVTSINLIAVN